MMDPYEEYVKNLETFGIKPLSDDICCRILAILYVFGGGDEAFTHNKKLLTDVQYAQRRLNLDGSERPNAPLCEKMKEYVKELEKAVKNATYSADAAFSKTYDTWAVSFMYDRYKIELR